MTIHISPEYVWVAYLVLLVVIFLISVLIGAVVTAIASR